MVAGSTRAASRPPGVLVVGFEVTNELKVVTKDCHVDVGTKMLPTGTMSARQATFACIVEGDSVALKVASKHLWRAVRVEGWSYIDYTSLSRGQLQRVAWVRLRDPSALYSSFNMYAEIFPADMVEPDQKDMSATAASRGRSSRSSSASSARSLSAPTSTLTEQFFFDLGEVV